MALCLAFSFILAPLEPTFLGGFLLHYSLIIILMTENIKMRKSVKFWFQLAPALMAVGLEWNQKFPLQLVPYFSNLIYPLWQ